MDIQINSPLVRYSGLALIGLCALMLWQDYRDTKALVASQKSAIATLTQEFQRVGEAVISHGAIIREDRDAWLTMQRLQGDEVTEFMKRQDAQIKALFEATGKVIASKGTTHSTPIPTTPEFQGAKLIQSRGKLPALAEVSVSRIPGDTKLTGQWTNYAEEFHPSVVAWEKADTGYVGTFRLTRTVLGPGGDKQQEEISLVDAKSTFSPSLFHTPPPQPRWTVTGGLGRELRGSTWVPVGVIDYRFSKQWGLACGLAGHTGFVGTSYRWE